jgi:hypothetical protein
VAAGDSKSVADREPVRGGPLTLGPRSGRSRKGATGVHEAASLPRPWLRRRNPRHRSVQFPGDFDRALAGVRDVSGRPRNTYGAVPNSSLRCSRTKSRTEAPSAPPLPRSSISNTLRKHRPISSWALRGTCYRIRIKPRVWPRTPPPIETLLDDALSVEDRGDVKVRWHCRSVFARAVESIELDAYTPVAVRVFPGNTADPSAFRGLLDHLATLTPQRYWSLRSPLCRLAVRVRAHAQAAERLYPMCAAR